MKIIHEGKALTEAQLYDLATERLKSYPEDHPERVKWEAILKKWKKNLEKT